MRNDVAHVLVGYDPKNERAVYRQLIPVRYMPNVLSMIKPDEDDPDAIDSYAIEYHIASDIMGLSSLPRGPQFLEYFIESFAMA